MKVAKMTKCHDFIMNLRDKYESSIITAIVIGNDYGEE